MQQTTKASTVRLATFVAVLGAVGVLSSQVAPSVTGFGATSAQTTAAAAVAAVAAVTPAATPAVAVAAPAAAAAIAFASEETLRARIKWVPVHYGKQKAMTLDAPSRILLAQAAAEKAGLQKVGLNFQDVYGVIQAETSWIPRAGMGRNGVASHGLAQFEPRTARGLGLTDPNDPVQAVYAAAMNMKHGAEWAEDKIAHLQLTPEQRAEKIREGVSVYYNLSIKGRNKWDGLNTASLPIETQRHIQNVRAGAERAADLADDIVS